MFLCLIKKVVQLNNHSYGFFKGELQGQRKDAMLSLHSHIVGQFCNALKLGEYFIHILNQKIPS